MEQVLLPSPTFELEAFLFTFVAWHFKFSSVSAIESFSKLGDSIYFEEEGDTPTLYIIQFISSTVNWLSGELVLQQKAQQVSSLDRYFRVQYTVSTTNKVKNSTSTYVNNSGVIYSIERERNKFKVIIIALELRSSFILQVVSKNSTLNIRIPVWTYNHDAVATINGHTVAVPPPGINLLFEVLTNFENLIQLFADECRKCSIRQQELEQKRPVDLIIANWVENRSHSRSVAECNL